ncbi:MAG: DUF488 domain-containing protein [Cyclobacteriaceae bacterium]
MLKKHSVVFTEREVPDLSNVEFSDSKFHGKFILWTFTLMQTESGIIWTIGHSTRSIEEFLDLLEVNGGRLLVDIRSLPGSRRYPHFNKENLSVALKEKDIDYEHLVGLGGRRTANPQSVNVAWRNASFRGYADYMQTDEFKGRAARLETLAHKERTAYMCSEAPWWKCHRALVSDFLKIRGWKVLHIMEKGKVTEHPFTSPARPVQGQLFYDGLVTPD